MSYESKIILKNVEMNDNVHSMTKVLFSESKLSFMKNSGHHKSEAVFDSANIDIFILFIILEAPKSRFRTTTSVGVPTNTAGTPNKGTPNKGIFPYLTQNLENGK